MTRASPPAFPRTHTHTHTRIRTQPSARPGAWGDRRLTPRQSPGPRPRRPHHSRRPPSRLGQKRGAAPRHPTTFSRGQAGAARRRRHGRFLSFPQFLHPGPADRFSSSLGTPRVTPFIQTRFPLSQPPEASSPFVPETLFPRERHARAPTPLLFSPSGIGFPGSATECAGRSSKLGDGGSWPNKRVCGLQCRSGGEGVVPGLRWDAVRKGSWARTVEWVAISFSNA